MAAEERAIEVVVRNGALTKCEDVFVKVVFLFFF